jgi:hypothetical protein
VGELRWHHNGRGLSLQLPEDGRGSSCMILAVGRLQVLSGSSDSKDYARWVGHLLLVWYMLTAFSVKWNRSTRLLAVV